MEWKHLGLTGSQMRRYGGSRKEGQGLEVRGSCRMLV
jgi:hypothetical protein